MLIKLSSVLVFFVSLVLFKLSLELAYVLVLTKHFVRVGYFLNFDIVRYAFSWVLFFLCFKVLEPKFNYVKDYFFLTAVVGVLIPLLVLWGLDYERDTYPLFVSFIAIFLIYFSYNFFLNRKGIRLSFVKNGTKVAVIVSTLLVLFLIAWYPASGVRYNLNFSKVYEYRQLNAELSAFGFLAYLNIWIFKVFAVFLLAYTLLKKKYIYSLAMFFVFFLFYAANTHKAVLFTPFLIGSFWLYFSRFNSLYVVPLGFSAVVILSLVSYFFFDNAVMSALFPNRVFEIPAHLTFKYFEFFKDNEFIFFSNSFMSKFIEYPYHRELSYLIGEFDGSPLAAANNGYVSSAYAQGGIVVVFVYSIVIGFILSVVDKMVIKGEIEAWFALVILMVPLRGLLISIDFLTSLITSGMVWALLLIYMVRLNPERKFI